MTAIITRRCFCYQEGGQYSTTLQATVVRIISDSECNRTYAAYGGITDRMICAESYSSIGITGPCQVTGS
jgi:drug/metabolite transporter superfamily protein YnfA